MSLGIAPEEPMVLFVGALDPAHHFKGFPVLVDALQGLTGSGWRLVVVGDGSLRASFEILAATHGLAGRVHFAGDVADESLPRYYRLADIHVLPSTARAEAFGLVVLEAAASGAPTIASSLPRPEVSWSTAKPDCTSFRRLRRAPGCPAHTIGPARAAAAARARSPGARRGPVLLGAAD